MSKSVKRVRRTGGEQAGSENQDLVLSLIARTATSWHQAAWIYRGIMQHSASIEIIEQHFGRLGLTLADPTPRPGETDADETRRKTAEVRAEYERDLQLRIQRASLYRACHRMGKFAMTDAEMTEALDGDPTSWPDEPPRPKSYGNHCHAMRPTRVYRMLLPRSEQGA